MIQHIWSVVCKESKIDTQNNVSIFDTYENIQLDINTEDKNYNPKDPIAVPFNMDIVSLFYREKMGTVETFQEVVKVLDPRGKELGKFQSEIVFKENHNRNRNIIKFNTLAVTISGTYLFQIGMVKDQSTHFKQVAAIPLDIIVTVNGERLE